MEEILNEVWNYLVPILSGVSVGGIITAVASVILKSAGTKLISKINVSDITQKAVESGTEALKQVCFTQTIQPVVESGLEKVNEKCNERIDKHYEDLEVKYDKLLNVVECLASYFDNSIGVPEDKKEALHEAIAEAKEVKTEVNTATEVKADFVDTATEIVKEVVTNIVER